MSQDTQPAALGNDAGPDSWRPFRVDRPGELLALLRQLRDASAPVHLCAPDGVAVGTTLWALDDSRARLNFSVDGGHPQLAALIDADEVVAVAYLDNVKLQFDLQGLLLVRGVKTSTLQAGMPRELYRFQRRNAYRVRTLERSSPTARLRHPSLPDMVLPLRVIDVSIGGCALFVPNDVPPLQPGSCLNNVHVELDADTRFDAGLQLQHVSSILPAHRGVRIGCEWLPLTAAAERALQRYIDQTQKRRRLMATG
jgi:c-di-GMP-binding flagellar brake protein YcgR